MIRGHTLAGCHASSYGQTRWELRKGYAGQSVDAIDDLPLDVADDAASVAPAFNCSAPSCSRSATRLTRALSSKTCGGHGGV